MASTSSVIATIMSLEWVEEVLILLIVFILLHKSMQAAGLTREARGRRRAERSAEKKTAMMAYDDMDVEEERAAYQYQRRAEPRASKVPETAVDMPGVTDSRFAGVIIAYYPEQGYGFIRCLALSGKFTKEVFLHRLQIGDFAVGSSVSFGVFLNAKGWPQAKDLRAAEPPCAGQDLKAAALPSFQQESWKLQDPKAAAFVVSQQEQESWRALSPEAAAPAAPRARGAAAAEDGPGEGGDATWRLAKTVVEQISQDKGRSQKEGGKKRHSGWQQNASSKKSPGKWEDDWADWDDWAAWDDWSAKAPVPPEQQQKSKAKGAPGARWAPKAGAR